MPGTSVRCRRWLAGALVAFAFAAPSVAQAQVVVIANGSPITEFDIQQRTKLVAISTHKPPTRQEIINELIDDRLKIAAPRSMGWKWAKPRSTAPSRAWQPASTLRQNNSARCSNAPEYRRIRVKARIRAELTWQQLIRGKYSSSLQVGDSDIARR